MHKHMVLLVSFGIAISLVACGPIRDTSPQAARGNPPVQQPPGSSLTERSEVVVAPWKMGDNPSVYKEDFSFVTHIAALTEKQTIIIGSLPKPVARTITTASIQMSDTQGRTYQSLAITPLLELDRLSFVAVTFAPREPNAGQLRLQVKPPSSGAPALEAVVAESVSSADYLDASFSFYREGYIEQAGYQISFNAWAPYKGDRVADMLSAKGMTEEEVLREVATRFPEGKNTPQATPTAVAPDQRAIDLSGGKPITAQATLRIEDMSTQQVSYLYILFLQDGEIKATLLP